MDNVAEMIQDLSGLRDDIVMIQSRLEQKLKEGRDVSSVLQQVVPGLHGYDTVDDESEHENDEITD